MSPYGFGKYLLRSFGLWWNYDLTAGSRWSMLNLHRRARFFGFTIGQCCIGVTYFRKEPKP